MLSVKCIQNAIKPYGKGREVVNTLRKVHSQQALSIALSVTLHTVISLSSSLLLGQY